MSPNEEMAPSTAISTMEVTSSYISDDLENLGSNNDLDTPNSDMTTPTSQISDTPSEGNRKRMKAARCQVIGTLLDEKQTEIDETSALKLDKVCYFKGYLRNSKDTHADLYVKIETDGNIKMIEIKQHMLVLKKLLLYFICRYFDITGILEECYNAATKLDYFHVNAPKSLLHQQLAYLLLKSKSTALLKEITNYLQKFPSNFKMKIKNILMYPRMTMQWITTTLHDNVKKSSKNQVTTNDQLNSITI